MPELERQLAAVFPVEHPDGGVSLEWLESTATDGSLAAWLRVVRWEVQGDRRAEVGAEAQVVRLAGPDVTGPQRDDLVVARCLLARIAFELLPARVLAQLRPADLLGGADGGRRGVPATTAALFASGRVHVLAMREWAERDFEGAVLAGFSGAMEWSDVQREGTALVGQMRHTLPDGRRIADVTLVPDADDTEPERVAAYTAAMLAVIGAVLDFVPSGHARGVALQRWVQPGLLDDPDNRSAADFVRGWLATDVAKRLLARARIPAIRAPQRAAPRVMLLAAMTVAGLGVSDALATLLPSVLTARLTVLVPLLLHYYNASGFSRRAIHLSRASLVAMALVLAVSMTALATNGPLGFSVGADGIAGVVFAACLARLAVQEWRSSPA